VTVKEPSQRSLFALPPSQRMPTLKDMRKKRMKALAAAVRRLRSVEVIPTSHGLTCRLKVADLDRVRELSDIGYIWVRRVEGLRRSSPKPQEEWFAVRGRVMIQIEGQKKGLQSYEDRILLVRARTFREAERRALREFVNYAKVLYLNPSVDGSLKLEKIIDVYETDLEELTRREPKSGRVLPTPPNAASVRMATV
jgi:hypothetical protein